MSNEIAYARWLQNLVRKLKIGGVWVMPCCDAKLEKVDEWTLKIIERGNDPALIEKTMEVGLQAGIKVIE
jgi:hypothetical protein